MLERLGVVFINLLFPPIAVLYLCGVGTDFFVNCVLFCLAVIPSHIHGFYISCTYFHRKKKVSKGKWPGGPKTLIESKRVINGDAEDTTVRMLKSNEKGVNRRSSVRSTGSRRSGTGSVKEKEVLRKKSTKTTRTSGSRNML